MSDRPIDTKVGDGLKSTATNIGSEEPSQEDVIQYRQTIASVLDRGLVLDRLNVENLPPEYHGEWMPNDRLAIEAAKIKGFVIDTEWAPKSKYNDSGDTTSKAIDVIHMVMPKWKHKIMVEERNKKYHRDHVADRRKLKEEQDFKAQQDNIGMPTNINSTAEEKSGPQIQEAISTTNK